jgi:hypothetical protein
MRISRRALRAVCVALTAAVVTGLAAGALGAEPKHHGNSSHGTKHHGIHRSGASVTAFR